MGLLGRLLNFLTNHEPVATATGIAGGVTAVIGVLQAFNITNFTVEQIAALAALITWVAGFLARSKAYAPATVDKIVTGQEDPNG